MKNKRVFISAVICASFMSCSTSIPEKVMLQFETQFANAQNVKWSKEGKSEYEAEFTLDQMAMSANYDADGNCVELEKQVAVSTAPAFINEIVNAHYAGYSINTIESNEKPGKTQFYEVEIKKGRSKEEIFVSFDGNLLENEPDED